MVGSRDLLSSKPRAESTRIGSKFTVITKRIGVAAGNSVTALYRPTKEGLNETIMEHLMDEGRESRYS